jgi:prepilin-type N-terminal cleavage/methylation domain-containing protein/prepilin-type processing-associated H-X9-DG protein
MKKKAAFTLIELLVVICIIAVLAGIALPVYNKVLEKSHATNDAGNLKQIGLGVAAYLNDNDEKLFGSRQGSGGGSGGGSGTANTWPVILQAKYVPNWKVFKSPFDKRADGATQTADAVSVSYGVNENVFNQAEKPAWDGNSSRLASPSQLILIAPAMTSEPVTPTFDGKGNVDVLVKVPADATGRKDFRGTHNSRSQINALYADTHVETLRYGPSSDSAAYANTQNDSGKNRWEPLGPSNSTGSGGSSGQ